MKPKQIVITCVLVVAAFFVGWLIQKKPASSDHAPQARDTVVPALRQAAPRPRPLRPAPVEPVQPVATQEASQPEPEKVEENPTAQPLDELEPIKLEGPVTDWEIKTGIGTFAECLRDLIFGDEKGAAAADDLRDLLDRARPEQMKKLIAVFGDDTEPMQRRVVYAHVLAQSEQPEALRDAVREPEAGLMVQRFAAHGLAFSDAEGLDTFMLDMAHSHAERGVRANLSFGLQRRGVDEGVGLYFAATDEALEHGDPSALNYVGGLMLIDERADPGIRERLGSYEGTEALLALIGVVQRRADKGAIPALENLAYDSRRAISVQKAAQGALKALAKEAGDGEQ